GLKLCDWESERLELKLLQGGDLFSGLSELVLAPSHVKWRTNHSREVLGLVAEIVRQGTWN
ncbi:unnamed protein product, partial [Gulo gulo]